MLRMITCVVNIAILKRQEAFIL